MKIFHKLEKYQRKGDASFYLENKHGKTNLATPALEKANKILL
jgi:hypothetical protein